MGRARVITEKQDALCASGLPSRCSQNERSSKRVLVPWFCQNRMRSIRRSLCDFAGGHNEHTPHHRKVEGDELEQVETLHFGEGGSDCGRLDRAEWSLE